MTRNSQSFCACGFIAKQARDVKRHIDKSSNDSVCRTTTFKVGRKENKEKKDFSAIEEHRIRDEFYKHN